MVTREQKEIGDVMAAALLKLRGMTFVTAQDAAIGEELARRWNALSAIPMEASSTTPSEIDQPR